MGTRVRLGAEPQRSQHWEHWELPSTWANFPAPLSRLSHLHFAPAVQMQLIEKQSKSPIQGNQGQWNEQQRSLAREELLNADLPAS